MQSQPPLDFVLRLPRLLHPPTRHIYDLVVWAAILPGDQDRLDAACEGDQDGLDAACEGDEAEQSLRGLSRRQAESYMNEFIDSPGLRSCPFAGKRAPEMAAGKLLDVFDRLMAQSMGDTEAR